MVTEPISERHMLPRWRTFKSALALNELRPHKESLPIIPTSKLFLEEKLDEWLGNKTLSFAIELAEAALFSAEPSLAFDAAKYILKYEPGVSQSAKFLAELVIKLHDGNEHPRGLLVQESAEDYIVRQKIAFLKKRTIVNPRNPFAWSDLAFYYGVQGLIDKAKKSLLVALSLAPESRHITRSLARLYTHSGDYDLALDVIRNRQRYSSDPWLLAAEIAVADLAERHSKSMKIGKSLLVGQNYHPFHLSELSSAIASMEVKSGDNKNARKHFRFAMQVPTENSCAQFEWAIKNKIISRPEDSLCEAIGNYEAKSYASYSSGEWELSVDCAWQWCVDQPFSIESTSWGSYVASVAACNYDRAIKIARFGLKANPNSWVLKNNLAFSLAKSGHIGEAYESLKAIKPPNENNDALATILATNGLLCFRRGLVEDGRESYRLAIEYFDKIRDKRSSFMAKSYLLMEEVRLKSERVDPLLTEICEQRKHIVVMPESGVVIKEIERELAKSEVDKKLYLKNI